MLKKENFENQVIIDCLKKDYGINVAKIIALTLGADKDASAYKVHAHDKSSFFVKLKRNHHCDIGTAVQILLHDAGIQQIISPIKTTHGQTTLHRKNCTISVYPFIKGQDGFSSYLTDDQWITLGKTLNRIHQFQVPNSISPLIKQEVFSSKWRNEVKLIYEYNTDIVLSDEITSKFLSSLKQHKSVILDLVDRAEKLSQLIQKESPDFVLCHGDIHAGNVLVGKNSELYIVDWDQPIMAPKECDLMFIGGGVGNVWNKQHEIALFYTGYGKSEINEKIMSYYRCERIIKDVVEYNQLLLSENFEHKNRLTSYNQFTAMFEPNGVVDIALQT